MMNVFSTWSNSSIYRTFENVHNFTVSFTTYRTANCFVSLNRKLVDGIASIWHVLCSLCSQVLLIKSSYISKLYKASRHLFTFSFVAVDVDLCRVLISIKINYTSYCLVWMFCIVTLRARCSAVYCNRPRLCVDGSVTTITRNFVHWFSPNRVKVVTISSWLNFGRPAPR